MATQVTSPTGRLRRLTSAALNADTTMRGIDDMLVDLVDVIEELDPAVDNLNEVLIAARDEFAAIGQARAGAEELVQRLGDILDLVEWALTPAFVAKAQVEKLVVAVAKARRTLVPHRRRRPVALPAPTAVEFPPMQLVG
ncbi:hypothetical protein [Antrihabitans cavernicola]|uniref:Uncharacterized protein n=1 Tax=Antrihabitans cavernicola TaxID=2495913 RepID=A0A5A7S9W5_9NOCA|nr:hypothetical protein [Spelaeibacter cavernicola]KAA0022968.1 hypothetical protein FOY51_10720 [Spelaeibacter cavernicola]